MKSCQERCTHGSNPIHYTPHPAKPRFDMWPTQHMSTQLEEMLTDKDFLGRSLLAAAASMGNKDNFEAVLDAVRTRLTDDQVRRFEIWLVMTNQ